MILLALLDLLLVALVALTIVTQIVFPAIAGTPLFPYFRRRRKLEHQLTEAQEEIVEAQLERKAAQATKRADALRRSLVNPTTGRIEKKKEERA